MPEQKFPAEPFLSRWSRRKLEAARPAPSIEPAPAAEPAAVPTAPAAAAGASPPAGVEPALSEPALPPVESLTFDSDFSAFLRPGVDAGVQRAALRKLLHDPRFNVMDGLDTYIADYSIPSPLDPALARGMVQARYLFAPPATRVTPEGYVEDAPPEALPVEMTGAALPAPAGAVPVASGGDDDRAREARDAGIGAGTPADVPSGASQASAGDVDPVAVPVATAGADAANVGNALAMADIEPRARPSIAAATRAT